MQRLSCFTHSLQLVIKDGLKDTSGLSSTLAKLSRAANLLHSGTSFKDCFEACFGDATIPTANATRWNSTLKQVKAYVHLDMQKLSSVLESEGHKSLILSPREYAQLKELIEVLDPFLVATNLTQGETTVTISVIVPCVLTLRCHLQEIREKARYCGPLVRALESSLKTRFAEVFSAVKIPGCEPAEGRGPTKFPFTNAYFIASVLDPAFGFQWLEHDVQLDSDIRDVLKTEIKEYIKAEGDKQAVSTADAAEATGPGEGELSESPPEKQLRMFSHYRRTPSSTEKKPSGQAQLTAYLNLIAEQDSDSVPCLRFWQQNKSKFPTLYQIATQVFSIPASSAPIERVFSHGGILMRPHRARLSSSMLSDLMFLKCNVYA
ncbi:uncharacterized protein LOC130116856 isoform X1 [Lampris incognitus]|uniref:uncharacterized protein LOC130116856 isoform X1 n=1 Tax=Lampris incognitus TaxID=2546036 RepID=UPI0024B4E86E|nr:uncharacterized protein LOC130116856 isoform X1 [Lampris incognitus]